ncbi:hypothetical protein FSP39_011892 [Pinctada imbricata]|uniref:ENTH domain-containing protein n=1 Tax=Pinctada imbricata TaxID=66713 RepID=A0AA88YA41_PINIB|nr:hypothetical protein FSP39_011892 [Pinctada imbricata]
MIKQTEKDLEKEYEIKAKGAQIRSRIKWIEEGEKNTSYFLSLEKQRQLKKSITKLKDENGIETTDQDKILNLQKQFYEKLYTSKCPNKEEIDKFINETKVESKLTDVQGKLLEGLIQEEECYKAVMSMKQNKSPGIDGINIEFYQKFWHKIKHLLLKVLNTGYNTASCVPCGVERGRVKLVFANTNVVMNFSEVETKVREATNDEAWGPHGQLMSEIARYTFTYEHFPEVMGMLWKRMLHDNKKNWRRTYKSLLLLSYLIRNGSERVVTSSREHLYDLRGLESYTFTDENGKDQGLNVRQKAKEITEFIQDDERLREERKKAKKNRDKYVGMSGDTMSGNRYSDRYDENPRSENNMEEIDDWDSGRKTIASEAVDKVKGLWNKVQGKKGPDDIVDYSSNRPQGRKSSLTDFSDETDNKIDDDDRYSFKDEDEEYTSVERTRTTHTEKITTNRRTRSAKKLDLGASSTLGKDKSDSGSVASTDQGPSLIDMTPSKSDNSADFADFQTANTNGVMGNDFNPRSVSANTDGFADFSKFSSSNTAPTSNTSELLDVFSSPNAGSMQSQGTMSQPMGNMTSQPMGSQPMGLMGQQQPMGTMGQQQPMGTMGQQPMGGPMMGMTGQPQKGANTWTDTASKVNISLDNLSPASKYQKQAQPSMNQLQQQKGSMAPGK